MSRYVSIELKVVCIRKHSEDLNSPDEAHKYV